MVDIIKSTDLQTWKAGGMTGGDSEVRLSYPLTGEIP